MSIAKMVLEKSAGSTYMRRSPTWQPERRKQQFRQNAAAVRQSAGSPNATGTISGGQATSAQRVPTAPDFSPGMRNMIPDFNHLRSKNTRPTDDQRNRYQSVMQDIDYYGRPSWPFRR